MGWEDDGNPSMLSGCSKGAQMKRYKRGFLAITSLWLGLLASPEVRAASLTLVDPSTWGRSGVPDYVDMHIYVPDTLVESPAIVVACHSCGTSVSWYFDNNGVQGIVSAADSNGFIMIFPALMIDPPPDRNCWDVGSDESLTREGGSDTHAIFKMVQYTLTEYSADANRVYVMGGSSGAMMTQALLALYPDVFKAGSARAGVPATCWAEGYNPGNQWGSNCAGGQTDLTAQAWGDRVRALYPGYTGLRPRVQLFHGDSDEIINYANMEEAVEQWTNVLELSSTPTSTDEIQTPVSTYTRRFWEDTACSFVVFEAWRGLNGAHSMGYESADILRFFALDRAGGPDPYDVACSSTGGTGGAGGTSTGIGATGGEGATGGVNATGGVGATGGVSATGGVAAIGGVSATGGTPATGGAATTGGMATGGMANVGGTATGGLANVGATASGGRGDPSGGQSGAATQSRDDEGCTCSAPGRPAGRGTPGLGLALLATIAIVARRRRCSA